MKIYSWNINSHNKKLDEVFKFIQQLEFDAICLQEVPKDFLDRLKELPYSIVYHIDFNRIFSKKTEPFYIAILTPHKIISKKIFSISKGEKQPLRTRLFVKVMKVFNWSRVDNHGALYADIEVHNVSKVFRLFCAHLRNSGPSEHTKEFSILEKFIGSERFNIICGDFNIIDNSILKPFNWIMGSTLKEGAPWFSERKTMELLFSKLGLQNPLSKKKTHTLFSNQLDHILVPKNLTDIKSKVHAEPIGSDHYPVSVEFDV